MATRLAMAALGLLVGVAACSNEAEIVAVGLPEASPPEASTLLNSREIHGCRAGKYTGRFTSLGGTDGGPPALQGVLSFELVLGPAGEFLVLQTDSKLQGSSSDGGQFTADVRASEPCVEGHIATRLENGVFEIAFNTITFSGTTEGIYTSVPFAHFAGSWQVRLPDPSVPPLNGTWVALPE